MYRSIETKMWTDPKVEKLIENKNQDSILFFIWLVTSGYAHLSGIYKIKKHVMINDLNYPEKKIDSILDTLSELGLVMWDRVYSVIFVKNMFKYQGSGQKARANTIKQLLSLHETYLITEFLKAYPEVKVDMSKKDLSILDRVSGIDTPVTVPVPDPSSVPAPAEVPDIPEEVKTFVTRFNNHVIEMTGNSMDNMLGQTKECLSIMRNRNKSVRDLNQILDYVISTKGDKPFAWANNLLSIKSLAGKTKAGVWKSDYILAQSKNSSQSKQSKANPIECEEIEGYYD